MMSYMRQVHALLELNIPFCSLTGNLLVNREQTTDRTLIKGSCI